MSGKRFIVFAGETYYPHAGWRDYQNESDTLEAAEDIGKALLIDGSCEFDWYQVVDLDLRTIVAWGGKTHGRGPGPAPTED